MGFWKRAALAALACLALAWPLATDAAAKGAPRGTVYLLRGFANVLSLGLDDLGAKLNKRGVNAIVDSYTNEYAIEQAIVTRYKEGKALPIILIGHSFGADATLRLSARLADQNIPVALIIDFDSVTKLPVPANVRRVINFYDPIGGLKLYPGKGFHGRLDNIDVSKSDPDIGHFNIEKNARLHARAISAVLATLGR